MDLNRKSHKRIDEFLFETLKEGATNEYSNHLLVSYVYPPDLHAKVFS